MGVDGAVLARKGPDGAEAGPARVAAVAHLPGKRARAPVDAAGVVAPRQREAKGDELAAAADLRDSHIVAAIRPRRPARVD